MVSLKGGGLPSSATVESPLALAARLGDVEVMRILIAYGAVPDPPPLVLVSPHLNYCQRQVQPNKKDDVEEALPSRDRERPSGGKVKVKGSGIGRQQIRTAADSSTEEEEEEEEEDCEETQMRPSPLPPTSAAGADAGADRDPPTSGAATAAAADGDALAAPLADEPPAPLDNYTCSLKEIALAKAYTDTVAKHDIGSSSAGARARAAARLYKPSSIINSVRQQEDLAPSIALELSIDLSIPLEAAVVAAVAADSGDGGDDGGGGSGGGGGGAAAEPEAADFNGNVNGSGGGCGGGGAAAAAAVSYTPATSSLVTLPVTLPNTAHGCMNPLQSAACCGQVNACELLLFEHDVDPNALHRRQFHGGGLVAAIGSVDGDVMPGLAGASDSDSSMPVLAGASDTDTPDDDDDIEDDYFPMPGLATYSDTDTDTDTLDTDDDRMPGLHHSRGMLSTTSTMPLGVMNARKSPAMLAAKAGNLELLQLLGASGAHLFARDEENRTVRNEAALNPVNRATMMGWLDEVKAYPNSGPTLLATVLRYPQAVELIARTGRDCAVTSYPSSNLLGRATGGWPSRPVHCIAHRSNDGEATLAAVRRVLCGWSPKHHLLHTKAFRDAVHTSILIQHRFVEISAVALRRDGADDGAQGGGGGGSMMSSAAIFVPPVEIWLVCILPFLNRRDFT